MLDRLLDRGRIQHVLGENEVVWGDGLDVERRQRPCGKVAQVCGNDGLSAGVDGGGEHVPVVGIGQHEAWDEVLVASSASRERRSPSRRGPIEPDPTSSVSSSSSSSTTMWTVAGSLGWRRR